MKKIVIGLLTLVGVIGCSDFEEEPSVSYLKGTEEVSFSVEKMIYTCDNDEFFFIEKTSNNKSFIKFMYGSYSTALTKRPLSEYDLYSDGVYNISFKDSNVKVSFDDNAFLTNCTKES